MRFKFKLEKVLELRKRKEQEREKELADLKELLMREETFLEELKEEAARTSEIMHSLQEAVQEKLDMKELVRYYDYLEKVREKISDQIAQIRRVIADIEKKRQQLVEASKERKIMEKLKDNQYRKFKQTLETIERRFLDELGTINYNQKRMSWKQ